MAEKGWAQALLGFSENLAGRGAQYRAGQQADDDRQAAADEKKRIRKQLENAAGIRIALTHVDQGNIDRVIAGINTQEMEEDGPQPVLRAVKPLLEAYTAEQDPMVKAELLDSFKSILSEADQQYVLTGVIPERKRPEIREDVEGYQRFVKSQERVFPGATKPPGATPNPEIRNDPLGVPRYTGSKEAVFPGIDPPVTADAGRQRDDEIKSIEDQGYAHDFAVNIVDGNIVQEVNPLTGKLEWQNKLTGEFREIALSQPDTQQRPSIPKENTLYGSISQGTGLMSGIKAGFARIFGQVGAPVSEDTLAARNTLRGVMQPAVDALAQTDRLGVESVKRVEKFANFEPSIWNSADAMMVDAFSLAEDAKIWLRQAEIERDNRSLPEAERALAAKDVTALTNMIEVMGMPEDYNTIFTLATIPTMTDEEIAAFMTDAPPGFLDKLPEDVWAAIQARRPRR